MINLPNVKFSKQVKNPTLDSNASFYELPFYKDEEYFSNLENYISFIKNVEKLVRSSDQYTRYIAYLKKTIGLTYCQVLSNIDDEFAEIQMHHGPILTLFDYAAIVTDHMLANAEKINSFIVANTLINEHGENNVQIVMLSKTVHEQVHENNIFLNMKHAFGNLNAFIKKYRNGFYPEILDKINRYIDYSLKQDSYDKKVLDISDAVTKWIYTKKG